MTGSLQIKNDKYYAVLNFKDKTGKRVQKWINLNMPVKDNKRKAEAALNELVVTYQGYESIEPTRQLLSHLVAQWLESNRANIAVTTYDQYFNILTWCWEQMSRNREERVLLICDEAYLMIDQKVPQSLVYLRNVMKRARKYEGALAIISHSIVDFLSESIKQYGQALLDIPCYKVLMGTDGKNLKETADLYDLTEAEQELLLARKRGHALFMVGAKRLHISFEIPEYKMLYMGRAGGR